MEGGRVRMGWYNLPMAKKIVVANWKMNPGTILEAKKLFSGIKSKSPSLSKTQVVVCPPFIFLSLFTNQKSKSFSLGAQDVFWQNGGSHTGEISAPMLKNLGILYAIVGHSERRILGETSETVSKKAKALIGEKIIPIVCIGERERDSHGDYLGVLQNQIKTSFVGISKRDLEKCIIAYEPIWAIGKTAKDAMDSSKLHETVLYIQKTLTEMYGRDVAKKVAILYGGSVEPINAHDLIKNGNVSGFLVGHASLDAKEFGEILRAVEKS